MADYKELESKVRVLETQLRSLIGHLNLVIQRGYNQVGPNDCVAVWEFRSVCKECGK